MMENMDVDNIIQEILIESEKLNSGVFTITRCIILAFTSYFRDGIQFREFKSVLKISDGKLASNLNKLVDLGYLNMEVVLIDKKNINVYTITTMGIKEIEKIESFIDLLKILVEGMNNERKS